VTRLSAIYMGQVKWLDCLVLDHELIVCSVGVAPSPAGSHCVEPIQVRRDPGGGERGGVSRLGRPSDRCEGAWPTTAVWAHVRAEAPCAVI
jgi:hypothetical protein